jgi:hypothetical protein
MCTILNDCIFKKNRMDGAMHASLLMCISWIFSWCDKFIQKDAIDSSWSRNLTMSLFLFSRKWLEEWHRIFSHGTRSMWELL